MVVIKAIGIADLKGVLNYIMHIFKAAYSFERFKGDTRYS